MDLWQVADRALGPFQPSGSVAEIRYGSLPEPVVVGRSQGGQGRNPVTISIRRGAAQRSLSYLPSHAAGVRHLQCNSRQKTSTQTDCAQNGPPNKKADIAGYWKMTRLTHHSYPWISGRATNVCSVLTRHPGRNSRNLVISFNSKRDFVFCYEWWTIQ